MTNASAKYLQKSSVDIAWGELVKSKHTGDRWVLKQMVSVLGYKHRCGLAVTPVLQPLPRSKRKDMQDQDAFFITNDQWIISHLKSGRKISKFTFCSRLMAWAFLAEIKNAAPWTLTIDELDAMFNDGCTGPGKTGKERDKVRIKLHEAAIKVGLTGS